MSKPSEIIRDLADPTRALRSKIPDTWAGFAGLHRAALSEGALPARIKELIALAIAVAQGCDGCIAYHARGAALRGATVEEVGDALGVALLMSGGPGTIYGPRAFEAFEAFAAEHAAKEGEH